MARGFAGMKMGSPESNSILPKEIVLHDPTSLRSLKAKAKPHDLRHGNVTN